MTVLFAFCLVERNILPLLSETTLHRLRVFENGVLRRIFEPKRNEVTGEWKKYTMRSLMICTHSALCG
jgi:hypothetical protein